MQEIELKFQIPSGSLEALRAELAALQGGDAPAQMLQAAYFDTLDRKLAKARAALRVRQENADWVQTLKAAGPNAMTRLEDNQAAQAFMAGEPIAPDLSLHQSPDVREALVRDLGWQPDVDPRGRQLGLVQLYRTDMRRVRARLDASAGTVEIALDLGVIAADGLSVPVHELEIELLAGHPQAVLDAARGLVERHSLWLDTQTKAHRGDQLAREAATGQPSPLAPARPRTRFPKADNSSEARWLAAVDAALEQIGANVSEVALVAQDAGHRDLRPWVKGWATGLRRLAWVWRHVPVEARNDLPGTNDAIQALLTCLRPQPGRYLDAASATDLARSAAATMLSLDMLARIVEPG